MTMSDNDWLQMKRLVLDRLDQQRKQLDDMRESVVKINTQLAILADREDREMLLAKSTSMKTAGVIGSVGSAIVAGLMGFFGAGE